MIILFSLLLISSPQNQPANENLMEEGMLWLGDLEGIDLSQNASGQYEINGRVHRKKDQVRVHEFLKRHPYVKNKLFSSFSNKSKNISQVFVELCLNNTSKFLIRSGERKLNLILSLIM